MLDVYLTIGYTIRQLSNCGLDTRKKLDIYLPLLKTRENESINRC